MEIEIFDEAFEIDIYGFGGIAINKEYGATAFKLSGKMWEAVKADGIKSEGKNIWVYEDDHRVFAGVEIKSRPSDEVGLEHKKLSLKKYAYYKHVGPYSLIGQAGNNMTKELAAKGYATTLPYVEIYGHWNGDETKCETELFMSLK